jgi:hypothetical protein
VDNFCGDIRMMFKIIKEEMVDKVPVIVGKIKPVVVMAN